jgi:hypothetical protein
MKSKVIFEFLGGCMDGKTVCNYSQDRQEVDECEGYLWVVRTEQSVRDL